jgi:concentrative nucleoside transporter, CNT family
MSPTPRSWRIGLASILLAIVVFVVLLPNALSPQLRALIGVPFFIGVAMVCSSNIRAINWRTIGAGLLIQVVLAVLILKVPAVYKGFATVGEGIQKFIDFTDEGAKFVFGNLTDASKPTGFIFAIKALPAVIFVSSFFTVLYYLGVLQFIVKLFARGMVYLMGTSGAETLSGVANVFMGQTEAPLIVKPYVQRMTKSELLALMVGGMATISGGVMVAYVGMLSSIGMTEQATAILATSVMAAPCGLYIAKILIPETQEPETRGIVKTPLEKTDANVFDAAARGASEGMMLVLNIAAMLIAFIAFIALINHVLLKIDLYLGLQVANRWQQPLSLQLMFAELFSPVASLMGVPSADTGRVGQLLGTKLVLNEFVAYTVLTGPDFKAVMDPRSVALSAYALTGFANFASIGIQLGGIGAMAPERRSDLAKLGVRALLGGFLATLINAAVAGVLM